jgi:hypothetical protein
MQPYFLPYLGYFQLIASVDLFIVYDNIEYSKKGWINRNRLLRDGQPVTFSLPLKGDSDYLEVRERQVAASFRREDLVNQFASAYRRAPYFASTMPLVERVLHCADRNLFGFLEHSILETCGHLGLSTAITRSSTVEIDHGLKGQDKLLALCEAVGAGTYVNPIGGMELYSRDTFRSRGIELQFLRPTILEYAQFGSAFVPSLSIVDVLMFNPLANIRETIGTAFDLI